MEPNPPGFTPAEERVLALILAGHTTGKEIAASMQISFNAARSHKFRIRGKVGALNTVDLVLWAWRNGYELPSEGEARP